MRFLFLVLLVGAELAVAKPALEENLQREWQGLIDEFVKPNGGIDFVELERRGLERLKSHIGSYENLDPVAMSDASRTAAYINLFNAPSIPTVYVVAKDKDVDPTAKPFLKLSFDPIETSSKAYRAPLGRYRVSLGGIVDGLLRNQKGALPKNERDGISLFAVSAPEPRVFAALGGAILGWPAVARKVFKAKSIDADLDVAMRRMLKSERLIKLLKPGRLRISLFVLRFFGDYEAAAKLRADPGVGSYLASFAGGNKALATFFRAHMNGVSLDEIERSAHFEPYMDSRFNDVRLY